MHAGLCLRELFMAEGEQLWWHNLFGGTRCSARGASVVIVSSLGGPNFEVPVIEQQAFLLAPQALISALVPIVCRPIIGNFSLKFNWDLGTDSSTSLNDAMCWYSNCSYCSSLQCWYTVWWTILSTVSYFNLSFCQVALAGTRKPSNLLLIIPATAVLSGLCIVLQPDLKIACFSTPLEQSAL